MTGRQPVGIDLAFRTRNEGSKGAAPIIYVHGAMSDASVWQMLSAKLARAIPNRAGIMIDLPGHGGTAALHCEWIEDYAASVLEFMETRGIDKAMLVGHSMGGAIAQQIAIERPEKVERLVLLATGARLGVSPQIMEAIRGDFELAVTMMKSFLFAPDTPEKLWKPVVERMKLVGPDMALNDFAACGAFDSVGRIDDVQIPAIVCCGEHDFMTSPKKNRRLSESLGCPYVEIPDAGHMIQIEKVAELAAIIAEF
ncbi:MAG: alpha/beta hydrolase [Deltaproteobacteria bacterium]|nr:alpha/beta hydrolase [Deltaproteobacteria bacterium]